MSKHDDEKMWNDLLQGITDRLNAEVKTKYHNGELDFIPEPYTVQTTLHAIIADYALQNFPELLEPDEQTETK